MDDLFSTGNDVRIARLTPDDVKGDSDNLRMFMRLVAQNDPMYPGIDIWLKKKVLPAIKTTERIAYLGFVDEKPIMSAVLKRGSRSKICHLKVGDDFHDENLGEAVFSILVVEARQHAEEIHFTLPRSLWEKKSAFFKSFGFRRAIDAIEQYRFFDDELRCSSSFEDVWSAVLEKLPKLGAMFSIGGYAPSGGVLLSLRPAYADKIVRGEKKVEVRRRFSQKWENQKATLYATHPVQALVGEAWITKIIADSPDRIWEKYNGSLGCEKADFDEYTGQLEKVYAIELDDVRAYQSPILVSQMNHLLGANLRPPQSHCSLSSNEGWSQAVSLAALLHGTVRSTFQPQI